MRKSRAAWIVAAAIVASLPGACQRKVTDEEKAFFEKAASIRVGARGEDVKRTLGAPRTLAADERCREKGGESLWIYDAIQVNGKVIQLGASIAFCVGADGVVKEQTNYMS